ncbi:MAG: hypothetical protein PQJ61_14330 [Spirochaetales bacterium]|uniref:Peptidase S10 n=1 Tax=Candidatus Thalassospirochaeta sargassi TaxID=3119039 RepID=A0AAJ1IEN8_9SPIO|nr:hypothetical protein [Spirochaetales bacterium]
MDKSDGKDYKKKGAVSIQKMNTGSRLDYRAEADWMILYKDEKPKAEMFYVGYTAVDEKEDENGTGRPVTFVFNGGPGASSVYLHIGALGPKRVELTPEGMPQAPPYRLADNEETWLEFSDLVFIDPIGTGFSRTMQEDSGGSGKTGDAAKSSTGADAAGSAGADKEKPDNEYWKLNRDLESLSEFIRKYLSKYNRWESPVYLAGESYGGFRVGKLVKMLQQDYGVGLSGAVLISPALEFDLLNSSDYDVLPWVDTFPTMAGAAAFHGKSRKLKKGESIAEIRARAADFAVNELLPVLAGGDLISESRRVRVLNAAADFIGLPREKVRAAGGRIGIEYFVKNMLRAEQRVLGLYDASSTTADPYPDRDGFGSPDPTLHQLERVFAAGINTQLRAGIGLRTEKDYDLLSETVNESWKLDTKQHALDMKVGAVDDLRYGMSLNPDMKVYISHGIFDLVTPSFSTDRLTALMKLTPEQKQNLTVKHYSGGHMYYSWAESRKSFFEDMRAFYWT